MSTSFPPANVPARQTGKADARHQQALACLQRGDIDGAVDILKKLLKNEPAHVSAQFSLGLAYLQGGRAQAALKYFQRAAALAPKMAEAHFYFGLALAQLHRQAEAVAAFDKTIALWPDLAEAYLNRGSALNEIARYAEAMASFRQALALRPQFAEAENGLGNCLRSQGKPDEAVVHFQQAIALDPNYPEPCQGLGMALNDLCRFDEAVAQFKRAIVLKPDFELAFTGWGQALLEMGHFKAARACWEKVIELDPKNADAYVGLGRQQTRLNEHTQALESLRRALRMGARTPTLYTSLGNELFSWGRCDEGLGYLEEGLKLAPDSLEQHSHLLLNLHYYPKITANDLAAQHRVFGEHFESSLKPQWRPHDNSPDPDRPLRVGFVSGDFRRHPVGFFMADLLENLKATGLELYAYANQWESDDLTERIKCQFANWSNCRALSDDALAEQIRADRIDILVDLSGHTGEARLMTFARRPAPVQVTYLGYPNTTGLSAVDYILGDSHMFPAEENHLYTETPWLLPDTSLCFMPPDLPIEVGPLPALQNSGGLTFGCLNKRQKISDAAVETWARILQALPGSRLLLQNKVYSDAGVAEDLRQRFIVWGIEGERIELIGGLTWREHLETYNRLDIALDPFPYNGTTTSVEGLWMGVPLLALKGDRLVAHMGESIMHAMGMPEWIAADRGDYVAKAVAFAADLSALSETRAGLRARFLASPISDAPRFARNLEAAFRGMWRGWCAKSAS